MLLIDNRDVRVLSAEDDGELPATFQLDPGRIYQPRLTIQVVRDVLRHVSGMSRDIALGGGRGIRTPGAIHPTVFKTANDRLRRPALSRKCDSASTLT